MSSSSREPALAVAALSKESAVADFVTKAPACSKIFDKYHIDFCCGGAVSLDSACQKLDLDPSIVLKEVQAAVTTATTTDEKQQERNWNGVQDVDEIIDYILHQYHTPLRQDLARLGELMSKVARVHGEKHPELNLMVPVLQGLQAEISMHLQKEENILFPFMQEIYAIWLEGGPTATASPLACGPFHPCGSVQNPIRQMEVEHDHAGQALKSLRDLSMNYAIPEDDDHVCNSYRALYKGLESLEQELHHHIHLENYILHPLVTRMEQDINSGS